MRVGDSRRPLRYLSSPLCSILWHNISFSWMYSQPVHSSMSCIHYLLGLPWCRSPSMIPSRTVSANCPALPRVMWPKYCSFSFATLPINSLSRPRCTTEKNYKYLAKWVHLEYPVADGATAPFDLTVNFWIIFAVSCKLRFAIRKINVPRLLVTVRVFCLVKTASKCTQTYHFGDKYIFSGRGAAPYTTPIPSTLTAPCPSSLKS